MGRHASFDYPHTCPKIDKAIGNCKDILESHLIDFVQQICSYIPDAQAKKLAAEESKILYDAISDCFETVRESNEDMREEANRQIDCLTDRIYTLEEQVAALEESSSA